MASSTRADVIARVKLRLRVGPHSDMDGDIFSLNAIIDEVSNDMSRRTRCYMRRYTTDITGTPTVPMVDTCIPELYEIISVMATLGTDSTANNVLLRQLGVEQANSYYPQWRTSPAAGNPVWYIYEPPFIRLYPQPNYSCTGGLVFDGYASPLADWSGQTDVPPVPERVIDTIVYGVAGMWGIEYPEVPNMAVRAATFTALYEDRIGILEAEINRQADRAREERMQYAGY